MSIATTFGNMFSGLYDATKSKGRRRPPKVRTQHEDKGTRQRERQSIAATGRDLHRNFAIAKWAVEKHLDFVSSFSFQAKTGDPILDLQVERLMKNWFNRNRCDVARRHPFRRMIRMMEARAVIDGDCGLLALTGSPGSLYRGKLQAIEGDRIYTPKDMPDRFNRDDWLHGVRSSAGGAALEYCICNRDATGNLSFGRVVKARNMFFHAYYSRFDQVRGVSPIVSAINSLQDVYEGFDYALAKLKVAQLFGLATYRAGDESVGDVTADDTNGDGVNDSWAEDFGRGPVHLDLDAEDKAEFLESKTPAAETVDFLRLMIHVSLKALDIPYSFFDESFTNFYGSRGGLIQYLKSCRNKIADLQDVLNEITRWRLGIFVEDGELELPPGIAFRDLKWEWVPAGVPWWDPAKEVKGHTMALAAGLTDYQRVCREAGTDFYENVDRIAEQQQYASDKGVSLSLGVGNTALPVEGDSDED